MNTALKQLDAEIAASPKKQTIDFLLSYSKAYQYKKAGIVEMNLILN